jgi:hypothetical protein
VHGLVEVEPGLMIRDTDDSNGVYMEVTEYLEGQDKEYTGLQAVTVVTMKDMVFWLGAGIAQSV